MEPAMIEFKTGNILNEDVEALVNTVNCVGIMGRGIALQFKDVFPNNFEAYLAACKKKEVQPGRMFLFETERLTNPHYIINFPTKRHWKGKSRIEDIESGLNALIDTIKTQKIHSIAIPPLGSGLGGLDWNVVKPLIVNALENIRNCKVVLYEPGGGPRDSKDNKSREVPKMTAGRAALVGLINRYLKGLLDPFITLLEVHKLLYFLQTAGEPLRLKYTKAPYGPYAENLRHVLKAVEGHLVSGYADGGDAPDKQLQLVPGALEDALSFLEKDGQTKERLDKVSDLVEGFETPFGLELLSTVHWIVTHEKANDIQDVVRKTYAWNERKKQFSPRQIEVAANVLSTKGWITGISPSN
jgi:O-acetyl-ADP-ribose deacetylase (regulator of RNase III)/uncharacterized protein YwgA